MEVILVIIVFGVVAYWAFTANQKRKVESTVEEVPYKVESPVLATPVVEEPVKVEVSAPVVEAAPVVDTAPAKATKPKAAARTAKPKAPAKTATKTKAPAKAKAPAKPRATKAKPQA
jgi:hypothetical protein